MNAVRNHSSASQNQSYLDDEQNSSQAPSKAQGNHAGSPNMSCPPKAAPLRSEAPRPQSRTDAGLDAGYTGKDGSTQVSRDAVNQLVRDAGKKSKPVVTTGEAPKPGGNEKTLCEKRKATNEVLCNALGVVATWRAGAMAVPGFGLEVVRTCESSANWLEENAPGGACGK